MSQKLDALFRPKYRDLSIAEQHQIERVKEKARALATELNPTDTREKSIALTKLEECVMWAVKGISA